MMVLLVVQWHGKLMCLDSDHPSSSETSPTVYVESQGGDRYEHYQAHSVLGRLVHQKDFVLTDERPMHVQ